MSAIHPHSDLVPSREETTPSEWAIAFRHLFGRVNVLNFVTGLIVLFAGSFAGVVLFWFLVGIR